MKPLLRPPPNVTKLAIGLGSALFLYLLLTGVQSLGIGEAIPTGVSLVIIGSLSLLAIGTAVVTAYLGGGISSSIVAPLAVAVGFSLFLVIDTIFRLDATVNDLPVQFSILFYFIVGTGAGLLAYLLGTGLRWGVNRDPH